MSKLDKAKNLTNENKKLAQESLQKILDDEEGTNKLLEDGMKDAENLKYTARKVKNNAEDLEGKVEKQHREVTCLFKTAKWGCIAGIVLAIVCLILYFVGLFE